MERRRSTVAENVNDSNMPPENAHTIKPYASKEEQQMATTNNDRQSETCGDIENVENHQHRAAGFVARHRCVLGHILIFWLFTRWWVISLVRHRFFAVKQAVLETSDWLPTRLGLGIAAAFGP
ncbi:hypothetical protein CMUS01_10467 [Colletotrichum musicola]|uniref:Uncharacterized protein n=1 Tax=Colletotrichum musicola TaxID=2175873 RepID=A0A8H6N871_9PEZI|nr:hypothetical protein CMUS01_10467 [Colletotrichum musicola]